MIGAAPGFAFADPDLPGRDQARDAAARELSDPAYAADDPSWPEKVLRWLLDRLGDLLTAVASVAPGGYVGLLVLGVLILLAVIAIRLRLGRIQRVATGSGSLFGTGPRSAADHRRAADAHAGRGEWADAVRERLRAVVRDLEERALLDPRPGRTAGEAATDAGRLLPGLASDLRAAATAFDEVSYGGRAASAETDRQLRSLDDAVRRARPAAPVP
jgi:Domain of unknown function (DUF4129)